MSSHRQISAGLCAGRCTRLSAESEPASLRIADEEIANLCAALEFHVENVDPNANHGALQLHKTSIEGGAAIHGGEEAERAFAPNVCRLDRRPVH